MKIRKLRTKKDLYDRDQDDSLDGGVVEEVVDGGGDGVQDGDDAKRKLHQ